MNNQSDPLLLSALENERRYTAKELHDGVAQTTLQLGLQVAICRKLMERNQTDLLTAELLHLEERIQVASGQVKALIQDLRPPAIDPDTLDLQHYIEYSVQIHHQRGGPPVSFQNRLNGDVKLSELQMLGLMRIVQEGLLNVRKHAQAQHVRLTISAEPDTLYLIIADDGRGFDSGEVASRTIDTGGVGLLNLQMRTKAVGGTLNVTRDSIGSGTKITIMLPL